MNSHPIREEDFDLYALGALDDDEKRPIESHLASCTDCKRKLAEAEGRIALLAFSAPRVPPSPAVRQRLMEQVRATGSAAAPPRVVAKPVRSGGLWSGWWTGALVPATVALAILTIWLWDQNRRLDHDLASMHAALDQQQKQIQDMRDVAALVESSDTITVPLVSQPGMPAGKAHVMYNSKMGMLMYEGDVTPTPEAKSYQLWLVTAAGEAINAGVFNPVNGKPDHWMMKVPQGIEAKAFAITLEPAGGMPQPTGPKVMIGPVS